MELRGDTAVLGAGFPVLSLVFAARDFSTRDLSVSAVETTGKDEEDETGDEPSL